MIGIWIQSQWIDSKINTSGFDVVYLDPKNQAKTLDFIKNSKAKIFICINCYENRPVNLDSMSEILEEIRVWCQIEKVDGIILDFIRHLCPSCDFTTINTTARIGHDICKAYKKEIKFTVFPFPSCFLHGQNPFYFKKLGIICPMLYGSNFQIWLSSRIYGECEPILKAWETDVNTVINNIKMIGSRDFSLFRYYTLKKLKL